jgi:energy-coupling factor transporter ATP-binding protein EcfA2
VKLSGGQQQRLAIAAILASPQILILTKRRATDTE